MEPNWLKTHLGDAGVIIADTRSEMEYLQGHIPGAILFDIGGLNAKTSEAGLKILQDELAKRFSSLGIQGNEEVVFYDESMGVKAPKALWFLSYAGYRRGRVLRGGLGAWQKAGYPLSWDRVTRTARPFSVNANPAVLATIDQVAKRLHNVSSVVVDVRSREEYGGLNNSQDCARNGRIPGAVWLEWNTLLDGPFAYLQIDALQKRLQQVGITPDKEIIVYCHSGNRSSNTYLALQLLGYAKVRNYVGSWHEWSSRPDLPIE